MINWTTSGKWRILLPVPVGVLFMLASCSEDDPDPAATPTTVVRNEAHAYVNSWIHENMEYWYLWSNDVPESPDKQVDPARYFESLLHPDDRFSWIQENYRDLLNSLQGINREAGYEFVLYREKEGGEDVLMQVLYTKPGSPADKAGLSRGDAITHINGQRITAQNYRILLSAIRENHTVSFKPLLVDEQQFGKPLTVSLAAVEYAEDPNYLHRVIEADGRRIGYFVYNFFATGTDSQPGYYDAKTDAIFAAFKAQGITDLVVDLRFNSGGSENSARNLASLIGRGVDDSKVFLRRQYNEIVEQSILDDEALGDDFLTSEFSAEAGNVGNLLTSGRVYILTSSRTASASELVINALKPFMEVFLIGDTTYGKNVGSVSLFEENNPENRWGMQPVVVKVYNSLGQSDYASGFAPDVLHKDNGLFPYPLGDPREALLAQAIEQITGRSSTARAARETRTPLAHSLDFKQRSFNLDMDGQALPVPKP